MISVVIPANNEAAHLGHCLASLKQQDFRGDWEIIVVDNASSDETAAVARSYGVKVIHEPEIDVTHARQTGFEAAAGDIIVQADADTTYPPNWLSRIARHFDTHPRSVALAGIYVYSQPPRWAWLEYLGRHLVNLIGSIFFGLPFLVAGANFAFRREHLLKIGGYDSNWLEPDQWGISKHLRCFGRIKYDTHLVAITSPRRVIGKPFIVFLFDSGRNLLKVIGYFLKSLRRLLKPRPVRINWLRRPISLAISLGLAGILGVSAFGYAAPCSQIFGQVYYTAKVDQKVVALSFDDGPNEPFTSQILDILKANDIKATFFVVGQNVAEYPQVAQRIVNEGHVIGNHSYTHNANHALSNGSEKEITLAQTTIAEITGVIPHLYRPPHGKKSPWEMNYLRREGLVAVNWSVSTNEEHGFLYFGKPTADKAAKDIIKQVKPGKIILLHDGYGTEHDNQRADRSLTVQALPIIIQELTAQGYRFITIPELLGIEPYN
jgi:peptidoglycan/xylan/chitin deacetylase (PgdA/CDA1 family)